MRNGVNSRWGLFAVFLTVVFKQFPAELKGVMP